MINIAFLALGMAIFWGIYIGYLLFEKEDTHLLKIKKRRRSPPVTKNASSYKKQMILKHLMRGVTSFNEQFTYHYNENKDVLKTSEILLNQKPDPESRL